MDTASARVYVSILALGIITVAVVLLAILLRKKYGWNTRKGQTIWLILGVPVFLGCCLSQVWVYVALAGKSPFDNNIIVSVFVSESVVSLIILFYYEIKQYKSNKP
jgi:hypothetical protein